MNVRTVIPKPVKVKYRQFFFILKSDPVTVHKNEDQHVSQKIKIYNSVLILSYSNPFAHNTFFPE